MSWVKTCWCSPICLLSWRATVIASFYLTCEFCITDSCLPDVHQEVPSFCSRLANRDREKQTWAPQPAETFYLSESRFKINLFHRPSRQLGCRGYKTPTCLLGPCCSQLVPSWLVGPYGGWQRLDCSHTLWFNLITVLPPLQVSDSELGQH